MKDLVKSKMDVFIVSTILPKMNAKGLSIKDLAKLSCVGTTTLYDFFNRKRDITAEKLICILDVLEIDHPVKDK